MLLEFKPFCLTNPQLKISNMIDYIPLVTSFFLWASRLRGKTLWVLFSARRLKSLVPVAPWNQINLTIALLSFSRGLRAKSGFLLLPWIGSGAKCAIKSLTKAGVCNHSVGIMIDTHGNSSLYSQRYGFNSHLPHLFWEQNVTTSHISTCLDRKDFLWKHA